ncbi:SRPBCC family protein [Sphingomonas bacterium]|uniref:SRPBCC family protein n=1 Tax=Sphingomonas bacterium TaxID=1895847 RepID=UPI002635C4F1|nr:SRPBCC family protein [Sphingomonas bacterium]MDB5680132.1 ATPase [Sphingomonas bacterium]
MTDTITPQQLRFERTLDAPVETVWRYLIEPELRAKWFMGGDTEPRVGGKFGLTFDHGALSDGDVPTPERYAKNVGKSWFETIERIEPPHLLAFSWDGGAAGTVVFELAPVDDGRTRLTLTHSGLRGADDARSFGGGWGSHLDALQCRLAGEPVPNFWVLHAEAEQRANAALA